MGSNPTDDRGPHEGDFASLLEGSWFFVVTFSTVGYGDRYPATVAGKLVTAGAIVCGVLFMAMPLAIVGNNFATAWDEHEAVRVGLRMQGLC